MGTCWIPVTNQWSWPKYPLDWSHGSLRLLARSSFKWAHLLAAQGHATGGKVWSQKAVFWELDFPQEQSHSAALANWTVGVSGAGVLPCLQLDSCFQCQNTLEVGCLQSPKLPGVLSDHHWRSTLLMAIWPGPMCVFCSSLQKFRRLGECMLWQVRQLVVFERRSLLLPSFHS